jgi:hypothetical protein
MNTYAIGIISEYLSIVCDFHWSSNFEMQGVGSERLLKLLMKLQGNIYITGHGARRYLDHELFERSQIRVEYMDYECTPYPQLHGVFNPYVSILDLIANVGPKGAQWIHSQTKYWREFIHE